MGNAGNLPNTGTAVNGRHLLRAIAARPSWVLFYHEYFEAGQYELTVIQSYYYYLTERNFPPVLEI